MSDFIADDLGQTVFSSWRHFGLVVQCVVLAAFITVVLLALHLLVAALGRLTISRGVRV